MVKRSSFIEDRQSKTRSRVVEYIKKHSSSSVKVNESSVSNVGPDLALSLFGKIYAGNPESGIVPGARPMSDDEKIEIAYKMARDILKQNGHDPDLADKWFYQWYGKVFK